MECHELQELLSPFLDKELGEDLNLHIHRHLASCAACRAELAALERLETALGELQVPVSRDLAAKVRQRLHRPARPWRQSLAMAVCLALGIFVGSSLTETLYPGLAVGNGITNEVASLEIFQDHPQGSLGGAFSFQGEEDNSA